MAGIEVMSHLVREEDEHQRERERKAQQQVCGMLPDPADWEQRQGVVIQRKYRLLVQEVELHAGPNDRRTEQGQHEKQHIEPPALAPRRDDPDTGLWLLLPLKGGRRRGCGFGHRNLRSEVRGQIAEVKKPSQSLLLQSDLCPLQSRAASQSTAVPCRA